MMSGTYNSGVAAMILDGIIVTLLNHNRSLFRRGSRKFNSIIVFSSLMGERYYIGRNTKCTIHIILFIKTLFILFYQVLRFFTSYQCTTVLGML